MRVSFSVVASQPVVSVMGCWWRWALAAAGPGGVERWRCTYAHGIGYVQYYYVHGFSVYDCVLVVCEEAWRMFVVD